ncbi:MAG: T9SS type A sorting domain-containing protein [Ignavibacterium sp.]|nr:MAG: T9SS type A sorting domain-containing protein [Ignavibacterium sp.]
MWYDFNADSGDSWIVSQLGHPYNGGVFTMQSKTDTIVTPSETFIDCYRIHQLIGADAEFVEWFAPGVGIVQRDVITIVGLRRWVLVDRIITSVRTKKEFVIPKLYSLSQNYPNPFNPSTKIIFTIPTNLDPTFNKGGKTEGFVTLIVYDVLGNEVATLVNEEKPAGSYAIEFDATSLPSGIYFYRLQAGSFVETKKMVLLR